MPYLGHLQVVIKSIVSQKMSIGNFLRYAMRVVLKICVMEGVMDLGVSIETCMTKYADFNGRASRSEFWWFFLFNIMVSAVVETISHNEQFSTLLSLALLLPDLAVGARRLHDIGKSGWWQLLMLTGIGFIPLLLFWSTDSHKSTNVYGAQLAQADGI